LALTRRNLALQETVGETGMKAYVDRYKKKTKAKEMERKGEVAKQRE